MNGGLNNGQVTKWGSELQSVNHVMAWLKNPSMTELKWTIQIPDKSIIRMLTLLYIAEFHIK